MNLVNFLSIGLGVIFYASTNNIFFLIYYIVLVIIARIYSKGSNKLFFILIIINIIFFITPSSFDFKAFHHNHLLLIVMCLIYIIFNFNKQRNFKFDTKLLKIFFIVAVVSYSYGIIIKLLNINFDYTGTAVVPFLDIVASCFLGLIIIRINLSNDNLEPLLNYFVFVSLLIAVLAPITTYLQLDIFNQGFINTFENRLGSINGQNPNSLSRFLLFPIIITLVSFIFTERKLKYLLLFGLFVSVTLLTFSRTAYISAFVAIIVIVWFAQNIESWKKYLAITSIMILIIMFYFIFDVGYFFSYSERLASSESIVPRLMRYDAATQLIFENPIFGVHPGNYEKEMLKYLFHPVYFAGGTDPGSAHNMFLHTAVSYGIPAGILFLSFSIILSIQALRILRNKLFCITISLTDYKVLLICLSLMIAVIFHGLTENYPYTYMLFFYGIFVTAIRNVNAKFRT